MKNFLKENYGWIVLMMIFLALMVFFALLPETEKDRIRQNRERSNQHISEQVQVWENND